MLLQGKGMVKAFGGLVAVNRLDIEVRSGEVLGLIGPNGCGKTTAINLLAGTLPLTSGQILVDGKDVNKLSPHARTQMGLVRTFQMNSLVWEFTVMENIAVGYYSSHQRDAFKETLVKRNGHGSGEKGWQRKGVEILEMFGIPHMKDRLVTELSWGQQRMVTVAMTLMTDPEIILLDEPAAGLRWDAAEVLLKVIKTIVAEGRIGVLLVEHNLQLLTKAASRIMAMSFGSKLAEGSAEYVLGNKDVVDAYLGQEDESC